MAFSSSTSHTSTWSSGDAGERDVVLTEAAEADDGVGDAGLECGGVAEQHTVVVGVDEEPGPAVRVGEVRLAGPAARPGLASASGLILTGPSGRSLA